VEYLASSTSVSVMHRSGVRPFACMSISIFPNVNAAGIAMLQGSNHGVSAWIKLTYRRPESDAASAVFGPIHSCFYIVIMHGAKWLTGRLYCPNCDSSTAAGS